MPPQIKAAVRVARRAWPLALAAYRRWERMPEHQKERYRKQVREAAKSVDRAYGRALKQAKRKKRR